MAENSCAIYGFITPAAIRICLNKGLYSFSCRPNNQAMLNFIIPNQIAFVFFIPI